MVELRKQWDPHGGRVMGTRGDSNNEANTALTPIAEFYGVMIGQDPRTDRTDEPHGDLSRLQRRTPRPRAAYRDGRLSRRSGPPFLGRLFAAAFRLQARPE